MRNVDVDYYGFRDEDDGVILKEEAKIQREELLKNSKTIDQSINLTIHERNQVYENDLNSNKDGLDFVGSKNFISHVPSIPSQQEVHDELIRRKKQELLEKYVTEDSQESEIKAKSMLGIE